MGQSWSQFQQRNNARSLLELAPAGTPGSGAPIPNLTRPTLETALTNVGDYLAKKKKTVTVIAVGGAVNTIHLRSRQSTHDVDFYNSRLTVADYGHLIKGAKEAAGRDPQLNEGWFNNHTVFFIPQSQRDALTDQAFAQNEVIFQHGGLKVLAAPWKYAFCCKVDRLAGGGINAAQSYDLSDAVHYLARHLARHNLTTMTLATVKQWFAGYGLQWTVGNDVVIGRINAAYKTKFGVEKVIK
ncbi:uncharacterized protein B0H64DRAFT_198055 [Chaetomium fimeti]|uniref:DUF7582 domain-containing protein n=1 Tax=Chaetomium fimeti TaxID=1854472 RepID=A0AAE0HE68_9PEZI|nr:hypothetical protein B0H64DRAFT_198055 [Chaetomium fimeti]